MNLCICISHFCMYIFILYLCCIYNSQVSSYRVLCFVVRSINWDWKKKKKTDRLRAWWSCVCGIVYIQRGDWLVFSRCILRFSSFFLFCYFHCCCFCCKAKRKTIQAHTERNSLRIKLARKHSHVCRQRPIYFYLHFLFLFNVY